MNRREILTAVPAALVAGAHPAVPRKDETPVVRAYQKWRRLKDRWCAADGVTDDESNAWCDIVNEAGRAVVDAPSESAMDLIYKLIAHTHDGDHDISEADGGERIWEEARALVA